MTRNLHEAFLLDFVSAAISTLAISLRNLGAQSFRISTLPGSPIGPRYMFIPVALDGHRPTEPTHAQRQNSPTRCLDSSSCSGHALTLRRRCLVGCWMPREQNMLFDVACVVPFHHRLDCHQPTKPVSPFEKERTGRSTRADGLWSLAFLFAPLPVKARLAPSHRDIATLLSTERVPPALL